MGAFETLAADMGIDSIVMAGGMYLGGGSGWRAADMPDRAARPLTICPEAGATVTFDAAGDGDYGDRAFGFQTAGHITLDGSPGLFQFQHYLLAQDGIFLMIGADNVTLRNMTFHHIAANSISTEQSSHLFYVSRDSHDILIEDIVGTNLQAADEPGSSFGVNALHVYTGGVGAAVANLTVRNMSITDANWAVVLRNAATGITLDQITANHCGHAVPAAMDFGTDSTGVVTNSSSQSSIGTALIIGAMTDGGGNGPWT